MGSRSRWLLIPLMTLLLGTGTALSQEQRDARDQSRPRVKDADTLQGSTTREYPPDNTGINKRDRDENELTADKQSNDPADLKLAQQIRRAIRDDDSLSSYARNIKVITRNGMVTLKGPVHSAQEKSAIEAKAAALAGRGKVSNQIQVKHDVQGSGHDRSRESGGEHRDR